MKIKKLATEEFVISKVDNSKVEIQRYLGALLESKDDKIGMLIESFNNKTDILEKKIEDSKYEILENLTREIQALK